METRVEYLTDHQDASGYAQTLRETTTDVSTGEVQQVVEYVRGHDELTQTTFTYAAGVVTAEETLVFGHDGKASVRVLYDLAGTIATVAGVEQVFLYDAYGNLLNLQPSQAATSHLYNGEFLDTGIGQQYLRARWYDPATGRFERLDPFFGNMQDPQSLHKYLYTHADPVNGADPSGLAALAIGQMSIGSIRNGLANLQGEGGMKVMEISLLVASRATTSQVIMHVALSWIGVDGLPLWGAALRKLSEAIQAGGRHFWKVIPTLNGKMLLPGVAKAAVDPDLLKQGFSKAKQAELGGGDASVLLRSYAEAYGITQAEAKRMGINTHHLWPASLRNHKLVKRTSFNVDAAINAFPINELEHGWNEAHKNYNRALERIGDDIVTSGNSTAHMREQLLTVLSNSAAALSSKASLGRHAGDLSPDEWYDLLRPWA